LAGITRVAEGALQVRNRIYQQVFDREWIKANKPDASLIKPDGERIAIRGTCSIGRALNNEIVLLGDRVSRRHAQVQAQGQHEFWLMDLGAANGTFCNGQRVLRPVLLHDQDQIDIGQFRLTFRQAQRPRPSPPPDTFSDKTIVDFRL
jgi:pSer/pThr/pTyr-binding forkhead associated (FHA) protein